MKNLTPAKVTMLMFIVIGVLVTAYVVKTLYAVDRAPTTRNLPMALSELKPGTRVTANHIGLGPYPNSQITRDMLLSDRAIIGRVVKKSIEAGTPILADQLYQFGERPPLEVAEGMRAVTINVSDNVAAVGGLIEPGQYVDVHLTVTEIRDDPRIQEGLTLTLFRGVKVLAVSRQVTQGARQMGAVPPADSVTLELTPEQANIIILSRQKGLLTLTYNPDGKGEGVVDIPDENRATLDAILGLAPIEETEEKPFISEVYRGTARQSMKFEDGLLTDVNTGSVQLPRSRSASPTNDVSQPSSSPTAARDVPPPPDDIKPTVSTPNAPTI